MYRGIIEPHNRRLLAQQVSVLGQRSALARQNTDDLLGTTSHWRRNRVQRDSSIASTISDGCKSSISSSTCGLPQKSAHKRVTFSLTADLTIHERHDGNDDNFDDCIVIAHSGVVQETEASL